MGLIPPCYRDIWSHKTSETFIFLLFSQYWTGVQESQRSPHWSKQSIPGIFYLKPHRKVSDTELELRSTNLKKNNKRPTCFQTLTFCRNLGFQNLGFVPGSPPGGFIFPEMTPTKNMFLGNCENIRVRHFSIKWLPFLCLFWGPMFFFGPHQATHTK